MCVRTYYRSLQMVCSYKLYVALRKLNTVQGRTRCAIKPKQPDKEPSFLPSEECCRSCKTIVSPLQKRDNPTCTADDNAAPGMLQWQQMQAPITPERPAAGQTKPNTPDEAAGIRTRLGFGPPLNGHPLFHGSR